MSQILNPRILRLEIGGEDAGTTIKSYLMRKIGFSSKQLSRFKYRRDGILLNGEKRYVNALLQAGDVLEIRLTQGGEPVEEQPQDVVSGYIAARDGRLQKIWVKPVEWLSSRYPLKILYEDQDILAADKPSGVVCHPSPGHFDDTLSNQVAEHLGRIGQELDVRVTGRLDRDTSGIVVFALNTETAAQLIKQRQASIMSKIYIARVEGHFSDLTAAETAAGEDCPGCGFLLKTGLVDLPLRREAPDSFRMTVADDGKEARTMYCVLEEKEDGTSLIACRIEHGRTHQIRVHMASIGHALVGDRLYGTKRQPEQAIAETGRGKKGERRELAEPVLPQFPLMLHAYRAELVQPFTGDRIRLEAPLPEWAGDLTASFEEEIQLFTGMGYNNPTCHFIQEGKMEKGLYVIENEILRVGVAAHGAELCSIYDKEKQHEVVWQADPAYWNRHAPVLFPFVGKVNEGFYRYKGQSYPMGQHGFARDMEFTLIEKTEDSVTFRLCDNEESRGKYPFAFELTITHRLKGRTVTVEWKVKNPSDTEPLYFSIGGHPAFNCPVDAGTKKTDYFIRFDGYEQTAAIPYVLIDQSSQGIDFEHPQELSLDGGFMPVKETTFDRDAYIFDEGVVQKVTLCYPDRTPYVTLSAPGFPSFGVWSKPHSDAPYICLEPWIGRCDNMGFAGELPEKYGEQCAAPGATFEAAYTIEVN